MKWEPSRKFVFGLQLMLALTVGAIIFHLLFE